jgi:hypothetical protein
MSVLDQTEVPITHVRDRDRTDAREQAVTARDAMFATYRHQLKLMIRRGVKLSEIEQQIDRAPLCDDEKAGLWLYAWSAIHYSQ